MVKTPPSYPAAYAKWVEGGWQSLSAPEAHGGQGLPAALWTAMVEANPDLASPYFRWEFTEIAARVSPDAAVAIV